MCHEWRQELLHFFVGFFLFLCLVSDAERRCATCGTGWLAWWLIVVAANVCRIFSYFQECRNYGCVRQEEEEEENASTQMSEWLENLNYLD